MRGQGTFTVDASGVVTFTPVLSYNGSTLPLEYTVKDNDGAISNIATITILVTSVNDAPVAANDVATTNEDTPVSLFVIVNDSDIDGTINISSVDLNPLIVGLQDTFTVPGQGTYTVDGTGTVTFTPVLNYNGTATAVNYTVNDNLGATSNTATITITVSSVNDAPVAVNDNVTTNEDTPAIIIVAANDTDIDGTINISSVDLDPATAGVQDTFTVPGQGAYGVDGVGIVTFTPVLNFNGICTPVDYTVRDNAGAISNVASITVTVTSVNDAPGKK
ncbi:MAG: cadherin-like domain-containing protein [Sphingobacterium sp.]|nr:cadherin-like domain-containing protein [Sphingobacterium sp.]